jgi:hypothetical protein
MVRGFGFQPANRFDWQRRAGLLSTIILMPAAVKGIMARADQRIKKRATVACGRYQLFAAVRMIGLHEWLDSTDATCVRYYQLAQSMLRLQPASKNM